MGGSLLRKWRSEAPDCTRMRNSTSMAARCSDRSWVERAAGEGDGEAGENGAEGEGGGAAAAGGAELAEGAAFPAWADAGRSTARPLAPALSSTRTSP